MTDKLEFTYYDTVCQTVWQWLYKQHADSNVESSGMSIYNIAKKYDVTWKVHSNGVTIFNVPTELLTFILLSQNND